MELLILLACLLATLFPAQTLRVTSLPPSATVPAGQQLILNCSLDTEGMPYWRLASGANLAYQLVNSVAIHSIATVPASRNGSVLQCVGNLSNGTQLVIDVIIQVLYIDASIPISAIATQVRIGESVILACAPNSWPRATISWWHNGSLVSAGDQLTRLVRSYEVAGVYMCRANNSQGEVNSSSAVVRVSAARTAVFLYRNESTAANLSCQGTQVKWTKSGVNLSATNPPSGVSLVADSTHSVLFIGSLSSSLVGTYVCSQEDLVNAKFVLEIPTIGDTFQSQPQSQGVFQGQTISLPCEPPTGAPSPLISWYRSGTALPLSNTSTLSLLDTGELVLSNFSQSQAGRYSCVAHNEAGFRNVSAELTLMPLPSVFILPGPLYIPSDQQLTLECNLSTPLTASFRWTHGGQLVGNGRELLVSLPGEYRCEVEVATSQGSLLVQSDPLQLLRSLLAFNGSIGDQVAREGDTLRVKCRTTISATFLWFHWTQLIQGTGDTLTLNNLTRDQAGEYKCVAEDQVSGSAIEQKFNISVRYGPFVFPSLPALSLREGETGMLWCEVSGYPTPSLGWFRSADNDSDQLINATHPNDTLILRNVQLSDEGTYKCVATDPLNTSNTAYATIQLSVLPDIPGLYPLATASLPTILIPLVLALALSLLCVCGVVLVVLVVRRCSCVHASPRYSQELRGSEEGTVRSKFSPRAQYQPLGSDKILSGAGARNQAPEVSFPLIGFPRDELCFGTRLGDGAYGPIIEGSIEHFLGERHHVAVECYISNSEEGSFPKPDELHTWPVFYLHHANLSRVLGICTSVEPYYVIYEYSDSGCLKEFLHLAKEQLPTTPPDSFSRSPGKHRSAVDVHFVLTQAHLLRMCRQAALGLEFLAQRDMVFRDVATRNCCVSSTMDIKLINLPIGPNLFPGDYYRRDKEFLPVRWMSPESLQNSQFTTKSDVWAYGVFCWEVFTYARQPYGTQSDEQVLERVPAGLRLSAPEEGCPDGAYRLMNQCWHQNPERRPSFSTLCVQLHDVTCDD